MPVGNISHMLKMNLLLRTNIKPSMGLSNTKHLYVISKAYYSDNPATKSILDTNSIKESAIANYDKLVKKYEDLVGLRDVQMAQEKVKQAENDFLIARDKERDVMKEMYAVRDQLKIVRERLSIINYSNPLYPQLANELHELVTKEEDIKISFDLVEQQERDTFLLLSAAMRDSYEKERARVERTKNWSLIGSIVGTIIGMLGTAYINQVRTRDLKETINKSYSFNDNLHQGIEDLKPFLQSRNDELQQGITDLQICLANNLMVNTDKKNSENSEVLPLQNFDSLKRSMDVFISNIKLLSTENVHNYNIIQQQYKHILAQLSVMHHALGSDKISDGNKVNLNDVNDHIALGKNTSSKLANEGIICDEDKMDLDNMYNSKINAKYLAAGGVILSILYYVIAM